MARLSSSDDSPPTAIAKVMAVIPAIKRIKPFLLGFVVAILLIGIGTLSSIHALCYNYNPNDVSAVTRTETRDTGELDGKKRRLDWREVAPFLSLHTPKPEDNTPRGSKKEHPIITNNEDVPSQPQLDPRSCFCHTILAPFRNYINPENHRTEGSIAGLDSDESEQQCQQHLQAATRFPTAFTPEVLNLSTQQQRLVQELGSRVLDFVPDFEQRSSLVPWGGLPPVAEATSFNWYAKKKVLGDKSAPLDQINGGNLFSSYLRIMKWPNNLGETDFPFKLCKMKKKIEGIGCDTSVAIQHTLEFREKYKPWLVTPSIKRTNTNGHAYVRGFSPSYAEGEKGGHAIVWLRLARRVRTNHEDDRIFYVRSMIREFDRAVAISLQRSNGLVGKFNAVVDGKDFTWGSMPSLSAVKTLVAILQDHFADRLGVIVLVNIGNICELLLNLFLPIITEEVRNKILMLPRDPKERLETLQAILGMKNIPVALGGDDDYSFNSDEYYTNAILGRDEEGLEYLKTMPFHA